MPRMSMFVGIATRWERTSIAATARSTPCPLGSDLDYEEFISKRRQLMGELVKRAYERL